VPAGQVKQVVAADAPTVVEYVPAAQLVHVAEAAALHLPAVHVPAAAGIDAHVVQPVAVVYAAVHRAVVAPSEYVPAGHEPVTAERPFVKQ